MGDDTRTIERHRTATQPRPSGVGERVRELRRARGLTQAELGGSRFSKEYVSQVELGKTRPSAAALESFA
ncbi:MAG: helix-turn-helix domain-containing protein, partial [Gaiellales bacterium]